MSKVRKRADELEILKERLAEAEQTLEAIRSGNIDALVVEGPQGENIYTLTGAEHPYRVMVETMNEGAATFTPDGSILYGNQRLADMLGTPLNRLIGLPIHDFIQPWDIESFQGLYKRRTRKGRRGEITMRGRDGESVPVLAAISHIEDENFPESICLVVTDIKERKLAESELKRAHEKLRAMASEIIQTEERERQRIATVLHDSVAQTLGVAKMKLEIIQEIFPAGEVQSLREIKDLISESIQQTRTIMSELSPQILYELGFAPALEWVADQMKNRYGVHFSFKSNGRRRNFSHDLETVLFQASRELMMNVVKHAGTRKASVSISGDEREIRIEVKDNGAGFAGGSLDSRAEAGGFGLFSIRERLNHFGGNLDISSKPGKGTRVTITAPVQ